MDEMESEMASMESSIALPPAVEGLQSSPSLSATLNSVIGNTQRKRTFLFTPGALSGLIQQLDYTLDCEISHVTTIVAILGALSYPSGEALYILLAEGTHLALFSLLSKIIVNGSVALNAPLYIAPYAKLVLALVRSIKNIYVDLAITFGTKLYGALRSTKFSWSQATQGEVEMMQEETGNTLVKRAMVALFKASPSSPYEPFIPSPSTPPFPLDCLLLILIDSRTPPGQSNVQQTQLSEMVCTLFRSTIRTEQQRIAVHTFLCRRENGHHAIGAMISLIRWRSGLVQEAALDALAALCTDYPRTSAMVQSLVDPDDDSNIDVQDFITTLTRDSRPTLRLAACSTLASLWKSNPQGSAKFLLPILLALVREPRPIPTKALLVIGYLIQKDEGLQAQAISLGVFISLKEVMNQQLTELTNRALPYQTLALVEENVQTLEAMLLVLHALSSDCESHRRAVAGSPALMRTILVSLSNPHPALCLAACKVLRGLSRSVNVLRTSLVDASGSADRGLSETMCQLIGDERVESSVRDEALGAVANLLLEFSPLREKLLEQDVLGRLIKTISSFTDAHTVWLHQQTILNSLWALRNVVYGSSTEFKYSLIQEFTFDQLVSIITSPIYSEAISEQGVGVLRNIACRQSDPDSGGGKMSNNDASNMVMNGIGETRLLDLIEVKLTSEATTMLIATLYLVVNLATGGEATKSSIMKRVSLLQTVMSFLNHYDAQVRTPAVWIFLNLTYQTPHTKRDDSTLAVLRSLGVDRQLQRMLMDSSMDVRERVKDVVAVFDSK